MDDRPVHEYETVDLLQLFLKKNIDFSFVNKRRQAKEIRLMKQNAPMNLCGPPALKPARHCLNASAARQGERECNAASIAQSSGPMCASQITANR